jgi:hypothetical protein
MQFEMARKIKKSEPYGDDPHVAEFPGLTVNDIKECRRSITLTVGQKKITKSVPTTIRV